MRYYSKIIDKEKQVLLKFVEVTKGDLLPYYKLNTLPMQSGHKTKALKNCGGRKRQKRKNKRKHSSPKIKHGPSPKSGVHQDEENVENGAHYVSKIVVDDNARSLKLSLKSCNPKKSSSSCEFKENDWATKQKERTRSRKAKRPRRVYRVPEHQPQLFTMMKNNENSVEIVTRSPEDRLVSRLNLPQCRCSLNSYH